MNEFLLVNKPLYKLHLPKTAPRTLAPIEKFYETAYATQRVVAIDDVTDEELAAFKLCKMEDNSSKFGDEYP